jgi:hypothetical protein
MTHKLLPAACALAALSAVVPTASAAAKPKRAGERLVKIRVRSTLEDARAVDNAPAGSSAGDVLVFTERLLDSRGRVVGSDAAVCTRLFDQRSLCTGAYTFKRRGQVMVQLIQPGPTGTYTQAVTGGTGRFAGARGTVTVRQGLPGGDRFSFRMRVPAKR